MFTRKLLIPAAVLCVVSLWAGCSSSPEDEPEQVDRDAAEPAEEPGVKLEAVLKLPSPSPAQVAERIRQAHAAAADNPEYHVSPGEAGLQATVGTSSVGFTREGLTFSPTAHTAGTYSAVQLKVARVSCDDRVLSRSESPEPAASAAPHRVEYQHDIGAAPMVEWYENGPYGLEQGFTVPELKCQGSLKLTLAVAHAAPKLERERVLLVDEEERPLWSYGSLFAHDSRGSELESGLEVRGDEIDIAVDVANAVWPVVIDPLLTESERLTAGGARAGAYLGRYSLAADATSIVASDQADTQGRLSVFRLLNGKWAFSENLTSPASEVYGSFGLGLAVDGLLWAGQPGDTTRAPRAVQGSGLGAAYAYSLSAAGKYALQTTLKPPAQVKFERFGENIQQSGDWLAVASPDAEVTVKGTAYKRAGQVRLYQRVGTSWVERTLIKNPAPTGGDWFGIYMSLQGTRLLVGGGRDAYAWELTGSSWSRTQTFSQAAVCPEPSWDTSSYHHTQVALGPRFAAVRFPKCDKLVVYSVSSGTTAWPVKATITLTAAPSNSLTMRDDVLAIAAIPVNQPGSVSLYWPDNNDVWSTTPKHTLTASDSVSGDNFGARIAIAPGGRIVVAAPGDAVGSLTGAGSLYVFNVDLPCSNGSACDDRNACTTGDTCVNRVCQGTAIPISDGVDCTTDQCDPLTGVVTHTLGASLPSDNNVCTQDICGSAGRYPPLARGPVTGCTGSIQCDGRNVSTSLRRSVVGFTEGRDRLSPRRRTPDLEWPARGRMAA